MVKRAVAVVLGVYGLLHVEVTHSYFKMPQFVNEKYSAGAACAFVGGTMLYHLYKLSSLWKCVTPQERFLKRIVPNFDINQCGIARLRSDDTHEKQFIAAIPNSVRASCLDKVFGVRQDEKERFFIVPGLSLKNAIATVTFNRIEEPQKGQNVTFKATVSLYDPSK